MAPIIGAGAPAGEGAPGPYGRRGADGGGSRGVPVFFFIPRPRRALTVMRAGGAFKTCGVLTAGDPVNEPRGHVGP